MLRRWLRTCARAWELAKREHSTPRELGWSIAVGVFAGCTPFLGLHMWIALALATLFRLNRLWAFVGSRISFTPLFAVITFCELESAHRLRTGHWALLSPHDAVQHGQELIGDWLLGTLLVGVSLAVTAGLAACMAARRWSLGRPSASPLSDASST
jgi:uncharacterized protein (DUF2062 family)